MANADSGAPAYYIQRMVSSRFEDRDPDAGPLVITDNDIRIFKLLHLFPGLPLPYIAELLGYVPKVVERGNGKAGIVRYYYPNARLSRLRKAGYVFVPRGNWQAANARYRPACYALDLLGELELKKRGLFNPRRRLSPDFAHDLGSVIIPASMMLGVNADERLRFIESDEIIEHESCPASTRDSDKPFDIPVEMIGTQEIVKRHDGPPWGIATPLTDGGERKLFCFLEFDRDTEQNRESKRNRASAEKHVRHILQLMERDSAGYKRHFGTKFFVFIVTTNKPRQKVFEDLILKHTNGKGAERICLRTVPDYGLTDAFPPPNDHALTQAWQRVGYPPFDILEALGVQKENRAAA